MQKKFYIGDLIRMCKKDGNVIMVRICGGMGNQLFQYAFGYAMSRIYEWEVVLDTSCYDFSQARAYALDKFNIDEREEISYMRGIKFGGFIKCLQILKATLVKRIKLRTFTIIQEEKGLTLDGLSDGKYYFRGFWQNEKYFVEYRNELVKQFTLKNVSDDYRNMLGEMKKYKSASIHIRRSDYIIVNGVIDKAYYTVAINKLLSLVKIDRFYIFTDDYEWTKEYFTTLDISVSYEFVSGDKQLSDLEELMLMKECNHHIVANSSFSWWGGWLSTYESKVVIAPKVTMWNESFYPKDWILIDAQLTHKIENTKRHISVRDRLINKLMEFGYL